MASRVLFNDSILETTGTFEFVFSDGSSVVFNNVQPLNNPMGYCCSLGFTCKLANEQFEQLTRQPFEKIIAFNTVVVRFSGKKQKRLASMLTCIYGKK